MAVQDYHRLFNSAERGQNFSAENNADSSASSIVRADPRGATTPVVRSSTPLFIFTQAPAAVDLVRLDRAVAALRLDVDGGVLDLAKAGVTLWPGGRYELRAAAASYAFEVDAGARAGGPLLARLIEF